MPTYTYKCVTEGCKHIWDEKREVDLRDHDLSCPICMNPYVVRQYTPTPTHFKGSGFYKTGG